MNTNIDNKHASSSIQFGGLKALGLVDENNNI